jgi:hypothetical protein
MTTCTMILSGAMLALFAGSAQAADVFNMPTGQTSLETVLVGNPGNANDTTGYGRMAYACQMRKYEVTNAQYCEFLNCKLPTVSDTNYSDVLPGDAYGLYNTLMMHDAVGGINYNPAAATGAKFSVKSGFANRPVNYVSWYDSVRFANWLQNGQGNGSTESGTYAITGGDKNTATVANHADHHSAVSAHDGFGSVTLAAAPRALPLCLGIEAVLAELRENHGEAVERGHRLARDGGDGWQCQVIWPTEATALYPDNAVRTLGLAV